MKISELSAYSQIDLDKVLDANDLENLIVKLAMLRSQTEPPVHRSPPSLADPLSRSNVSVQRDPDIQLAALSDGGIRLWLRHTGLAWMAVQFSPDKARLFRDYLSKWVHGAAPMNLISDEERGSGTLQ